MPVVLPKAHAATVPSRNRSAGRRASRLGELPNERLGCGAGRALHAWRLHDEGRETAQQHTEQEVYGW